MAELTLTYRDYTVGWICALEVEQAAARALLDSEHPRLPSIVGDTNIYYRTSALSMATTSLLHACQMERPATIL
jgi:hypothetical protein